MIKVYLGDGSYFYFNNGVCTHFIFDVNGDKLPNSAGKDIFHFLICTGAWKNYYWGQNSKNFGPFCDGGCSTREDALSACKNHSVYCSAILMIDNWKFSDDYPYKL